MKLTYEHAHILHSDHDEAVRFYREILGARVVDTRERKGAPQTKLMVGGGMLIVRGISIIEEDDMPHLEYLYFEGPDGVVIELMETKAPLGVSPPEQDEES